MIKQYLNNRRKRINFALSKCLKAKEGTLSPSMRYAAVSGGKRLRPLLFISGLESFGGKITPSVLKVACAVEFIHAFSLAQDDLPAMDNDDFRRGKPTLHKVFGEDVALLASDALLNEAYALIIDDKGIKPETKIKIISEFAGAVRDLISGQEEDLRLLKKRISRKKLDSIYLKKTGALLSACLRLAAILSNKEEILDKLTSFGRKLGLAYQIWDDILNLAGKRDKLKGKRNSDARAGKFTYVSLLGLGGAKGAVSDLAKKIDKDLERLSLEKSRLAFLYRLMLQRAY